MQRKGSAVWQGDLKREGYGLDRQRRLIESAVLVLHAIRERQGHEPGRIDRGCACRLLHDGAFGAIGECRSDA